MYGSVQLLIVDQLKAAKKADEEGVAPPTQGARARGVVMTRSMLSGWWMLGCYSNLRDVVTWWTNINVIPHDL